MACPPSGVKLMKVADPYELAETRHGMMLVNRNDVYMGQALLLYGECCELESRFLLSLLRNPGLVIEVGANMGIHTVPMARFLAGQGRTMLAFEPQPVIFQQLCANLALNGLMNVKALPFACGRQSGVVTIETSDYRSPGNFGAAGVSPEAVAHNARSETVQCVRVDDLVTDGPVGLIKVDVEGFEQQVLEGCERILARCRPLLYVENDRLENSASLIQWLFDHDYRLWWHLPPLFNPENLRGVRQNAYPGVVSLNMLGVHKSVAIPLKGMAEIVDAHEDPMHRQPRQS
jgi:FkbM family methyltransferase